MFVDHFDFTKPLFWTVDEVLSPEECQALIERAESQEWLPATVNSAEGRVVAESVRSNDTALLRDPELASLLEERLVEDLPADFRGHELFGIGPSLRCYRYHPGQHFGLHTDQSYRGPDHEGHEVRSQLTLLVYLNQEFVGGETDFPEQEARIEPRRGRALLFQHRLLHEGRKIEQGIKYVLRTDVFFLERSALE